MSRHSKQFGDWMRKRREALGMTQAELSGLTGIQRPNLSRIERGRHNPSLATMALVIQSLRGEMWVGVAVESEGDFCFLDSIV